MGMERILSRRSFVMRPGPSCLPDGRSAAGEAAFGANVGLKCPSSICCPTRALRRERSRGVPATSVCAGRAHSQMRVPRPGRPGFPGGAAGGPSHARRSGETDENCNLPCLRSIHAAGGSACPGGRAGHHRWDSLRARGSRRAVSGAPGTKAGLAAGGAHSSRARRRTPRLRHIRPGRLPAGWGAASRGARARALRLPHAGRG